MSNSDLTFLLGGEAGQGVESSGAGFAKALARGGLSVLGTPDYMSRIRGGHNFFLIRAGTQPIHSPAEKVHLLLAFDEETLQQHAAQVVPGGGMIYDARWKVDEAKLLDTGAQLFPVPLEEIAETVGGNKLMANTAALGAAAGVVGYGIEYLHSVIADNFRRKGEAVVDANRRVVEVAYEYSAQHYADRFEWKLPAVSPLGQSPWVLANGNQALALGALAAGCRFISAYPMTPASSIFEWMVAHGEQFGVVTKQTEDEIAAIAMAIGAAHTGARAMTATSGGGFSLMVESLGLAGMLEEPVVIVDAQRPGPSTGMPTRTDQADLLFVIHASQGEFPRIVLAPGTVEQAFDIGARAFNLAEKYQLPVIILTDAYLANTVQTVPRAALNPSQVQVDRGELLDEEQLDKLQGPYLRYRLTDSGISPRALPGHPQAVYVSSSDEHTPSGAFEDEDAQNRIQMNEKRQRKLESARRAMRAPQRYGVEQPDFTFLCWGSSVGAVREAVDAINRAGGRAALVHLTDMWPFPQQAVAAALARPGRLVLVEGNLTGQLGRLLRAETGIVPDYQILRDDGRPLSAGYILQALRQLTGQSQTPRTDGRDGAVATDGTGRKEEEFIVGRQAV
ncbi:MAG: 2-oxoacid:acceptor oxidoreductase subunit alpha [Limnochordaceae bacterium]|nr:2-oxoacid:acceptor oxidoreductase subunit alpha [Limnochordaceae bacterium]